jgi:hypothetical protein
MLTHNDELYNLYLYKYKYNNINKYNYNYTFVFYTSDKIKVMRWIVV